MAESCGLVCAWCQSAQLACVSSIGARLGPGAQVNVESKRCTTGTVTHTRGVCGAHTVGSIGRSLGLGVWSSPPLPVTVDALAAALTSLCVQ
jgi:hypothetical protein